MSISNNFILKFAGLKDGKHKFEYEADLNFLNSLITQNLMMQILSLKLILIKNLLFWNYRLSVKESLI